MVTVRDPWRDHCYGREPLLERLRAMFDVAASRTPQLLVLRGMTGIGKTRLAQELYRCLSRERDPSKAECRDGYWPDAFSDAATHMHVNPRFPDSDEKPEIPFLWWALQFREDHVPGEAIIRALPELVPHAAHVVARRRIAQIGRDWWWKRMNVATAGLGLVPGVGVLAGIPGLLKDRADVRRSAVERRALEQQSSESIADARRREEQARATQVLDTLRLFLDPTQADSPTVPVVLVLDDAHWMDVPTLEIVTTLWQEARQASWPLLILATHWDDEWALQREVPTGLARFTAEQDGVVWDVGGIDARALREWIRQALPGLEQDHVDLLLDKAAVLDDRHDRQVQAGSPRVVEQLIEWLLDDPGECFESADPGGPLRPGVAESIRSTVHDLRDIVTNRFKRMGATERKILGWCAEQGRRFLVGLCSAVAADLRADFDDEALRGELLRAESVRHWIDRIPQPNMDPGRFQLCEFRSVLHAEVARAHYSKRMHGRDQVTDALRRVLKGWLDAGRLDLLESGEVDESTLSFGERREALLLAVRVFRPRLGMPGDDAYAVGFAHALVRLVNFHASAHRWGEPSDWEQAEAMAIIFSDHPEWSIEVVSLSQQISISDVLVSMRKIERALSVLRSLQRQTAEMPVDRRQRALIAERLGQALSHSGAGPEALGAYGECLKICRSIELELGRSPKALNDLSVSLDRVADAMLQFGVMEIDLDGVQPTSALDLYRESLDLRRTIVRENGRTQEALGNVCVSLDRIGDLMLERGITKLELEGESKSVLALHSESLELRRAITQEHGQTHGARRGLSVSLIKVANGMRAQGVSRHNINGEPKSALDLYMEALELQRALGREYGWTPEALRDVSVSLDSIADEMRAQGYKKLEFVGEPQKSALDLYTESLRHHRMIVRKFGETPETLNDLSASLVSVADEMLRQEMSELELDGETKSALVLHRESLGLRRAILHEYGRTPTSMFAVMISLERVANTMRAEKAGSVLGLYQESLELGRAILIEFGRDPDTLRGVSVLLEHIADEMRLQAVSGPELGDEQRSVLDLYAESLSFRRVSLCEFGTTPRALRDVSVSLDKLADAMLTQRVSMLELDGEQRPVVDLCRESLDLRRQIEREYGRTPESLRDVGASHSRLAIEAALRGDQHVACEELKQLQEVLDEIEARGWADTQMPSDRRWLEAERGKLQCTS